MTTDKPIVHFSGKPEFFKRELVGELRKEYEQYLDAKGCYEKAKVFGLDHPIIGKDLIYTSIVVKKNDDGSFETLNTLYVPDTKETDEQES